MVAQEYYITFMDIIQFQIEQTNINFRKKLFEISILVGSEFEKVDLDDKDVFALHQYTSVFSSSLIFYILTNTFSKLNSFTFIVTVNQKMIWIQQKFIFCIPIYISRLFLKLWHIQSHPASSRQQGTDRRCRDSQSSR